jgi:YidC/Oxa1 family membrane protein insertase
MVVTMVAQQKMQPLPPDPQQQQQAKMMQYMMVLFGVMFYHVPSGLVLYFLTSSLLGMAEQRWVKSQLAADDATFKAGPARGKVTDKYGETQV